MENIFLKLLNMSIAAGWLILAVIVLRIVLKKAPKYIRCILWGLVGIRLIFPFSIESVLSLIPSKETLPQETLFSKEPTIHSGVEVVDQVVNPVFTQSFAPASPVQSVNPLQVWTYLASYIWIVGVLVMLAYVGFSYWRLRRRLDEAVLLRDHIWQCDRIDTPFILGIFRPRIYLPSDMSKTDIEFVIAHEQAHLKRRDHWWKPLGYILLSVYWFQPLCRIAYILLCRDIELACDEKVVKAMSGEDKKAYSYALLACSVPRKMISACPLAFGEVGVKERVKSVLNYRKPAFWISAAAAVVCMAVAVCFLTNPVEETEEKFAEQSAADFDVPEKVWAYAEAYLQSAVEKFNEEGAVPPEGMKGYKAVDAEVTGLTRYFCIGSGRPLGIETYILEFRIKPDKPENVVLADGMELEDGWITEKDSDGQPHIIYMTRSFDNNMEVWSDISDFRIEAPDEENMPQEILTEYVNSYEEVCWKIYKDRVYGSFEVNPFEALQEILADQETIPVTLFTEQGEAWDTYYMDSSLVSLMEEYFKNSHSLKEMDGLPQSKEKMEYYIQFSSSDGGKYLALYPDGQGIVEYFDGQKSSYWSIILLATKSNNYNADSIVDLYRQFYDNLEINNMQKVFGYEGTAEAAAEHFVYEIYGSWYENLAPGNGYGFGDYEVTEWGIYQVGEDDSAVTGWFRYAMIPWEEDSSAWADNTEEGAGSYEGKRIAEREFFLENQEDGSWSWDVGISGYERFIEVYYGGAENLEKDF